MAEDGDLVLSLALLADATRLAMAVALQDVVADHCPNLTVDPAEKSALMLEFRQYDLGGIYSMVSPPLNAFYEEFLGASRKSPSGFCASAPDLAGRAGFPALIGKK
jgi:hypothetical protein